MKGSRESQRRWIGDNPSYVLANSHVYDFLEVINEYWTSYWSLDPWIIPPQIKYRPGAKTSAREVMKAAVASRMDVLERARHRTQRMGDPVGLHAGGMGVLGLDHSSSEATASDRLLWIAVILRAVTDYAQGITSPHARDQRAALNAYLWIMGKRWPVHARVDPWNMNRTDILHPEECPWATTGFSPAYLVKVPKEGEVPEFPKIDAAAQEWNRQVSFQAICDMLRLSANAIRYRLHLIPPITTVDIERGPSWSGHQGATLDILDSEVDLALAALPSFWDSDD
jgi:hypothetical protein